MRDQQIADLIARENHRQVEGIELIASENYASDQVMEAQGSVLINKYAEGLPRAGITAVAKWWTKWSSWRLMVVQTVWCRMGQCPAALGCFGQCGCYARGLNAGDSILGFDLSHGGHLTHGSTVNYSGKLYKPHFYGVEKETGPIDMDKVATTAAEVKPKLIICGASAYSRDWDYARFREIADSVGALLLADISHPSGLIAAGLLNNPMPHCHIVTPRRTRRCAAPAVVSS